MHFKDFLPALFLFAAAILQVGDAAQSKCTSSEISRMNVTHCDCAGVEHGCSSNCPVCDVTNLTKAVYHCATAGCTDNQYDCGGCGIFFHSLCDCIQGTVDCPTSSPFKVNSNPIWVLLPAKAPHDPLITTTERLPGILEMGHGHDHGWIYAQEKYNSKTESLWLNSVRARDMEQVHVHMCKRNENTAKILSHENIVSSSHLVQLKNDTELYCLGVDHNVTITGFSGALSSFLAKPPVCKELIGAGILHDHKNRTWACASTTHMGPKGKFC
ncbi:hypothetical protein RJ55_01581 [Drechmeria coniospora]|nr:hypothetical protein RJ55_01581 [Drechmeria coniospora]